MKFLRHPIRSIREPFGKAGLIVACLALVFAMAGGAIAAKGALTGKQKKEVEKIAKKFAGKPGPEGKQGPAGTNGTNGKDGTSGTSGTNGESVTLAAATGCASGGAKLSVGGSSKEVCNGANGAPGSPGSPGESVEATTIPTGITACNEQGGVEYEVGGSATEICNGKEGSPWTAGGTLPKGATEEGTWAFIVGPENSEFGRFLGRGPISFGIPLASEPTAVVLKENEGHTTDCPGTAEEPKAKEGFLCIYIEIAAAIDQNQICASAFQFGGLVATNTTNAEEEGALASGSWAVTAG